MHFWATVPVLFGLVSPSQPHTMAMISALRSLLLIDVATTHARASTAGTCAASSDLKWLWGTPVYIRQLQLPEHSRDHLVGLITAKYFSVNNTLGGTPAKVNDDFYAYQQDHDSAWMDARHDCFRKYSLASDGPAPDETQEALSHRRNCEEEALQVHWRELKLDPAWETLSSQIQHHCQVYLDLLGVHGDTRGSFEFGADGKELIWSWVSVHHDGIEHLMHDHPTSLLSGTLYLQIPPDSGRLMLQDPRQSRKGGAVHNFDLIFEGFLLENSSGFSELLILFAGE